VDDAELRGRRRRAVTLREDVERAHDVADDLDRVAERVEHRLDPVVAVLVPGVWAGRAADEARSQAGAASDALSVAAHQLRLLAALVREEAEASARVDLLVHGVTGSPGRADATGPA
jgi:hypothetical protein